MTEKLLDTRTGGAAPWIEQAPFAPSQPRIGSRFDETVAQPIDAPRRLEAIVHAAEQLAREATQARRRLTDGTYGLCLTCTDHIPLAVLHDRPWARQCTYCALDI
jgi:RNA polymerase-binding transcription factor DksA